MNTNYKGYTPLNESKKAKDIQVVFLSARAEKTKKDSNSMFFFEKEAKKTGIKMITIDPSSSTIKKINDDEFKVVEKSTEKREYTLNPSNTIICPRRTVLKNSESKDFLLELQNHKFFCFNTLDALEVCEDKFVTYKRLKDMGVPTPKTVVVTNTSMNKLEEKVESIGNHFPIICKISSGGTQGCGVFIIDSMVSLKSTLQSIFKLAPKADIILQEKIEADHDLRVHVIYDGFEQISTGIDGFKVIGCMRRNVADQDFRTNYSIGATAEKGTITPEQERIAKLAAKATNCRWCGVDLIVDSRTNQCYVLECNSSPGTKGITTAAGDDVVHTIFEMFKNFKYTRYDSNQIGQYETCTIKDLNIESTIKFDTHKGFTEMECSSVNAKDDDVDFVYNGITYHRELSGIRKGDPMIELNIRFNGTTYKNELVVLKQVNNNLNKNIFVGGTKLLGRIGSDITIAENSFILTDNTLDFEVPVEKVEEGLLTEGRNWLFNVNDEDIKLSGLRKCLDMFNNGSRGRYTRGKWSIANGGYDLDWEIYYNDQPFLGKTANDDAKFYHTYMPVKLAYKIAGIVESIFDCKVDTSNYE